MLKRVLNEIKSQADPVLSHNTSIKNWKDSGNPVFGYICTNIPEELIYAADILPVRLIGGNVEISQAYNHLPAFVCHFTRSCLELALSGGYGCLDGIALAYGCDAGCSLFHVLIKNLNLPYQFFMYHPLNTEPEHARTFFEAELKKFQSSLEAFVGHAITEPSMRRAISIYNKNRELLKKLYDIRGQSENVILSGTEVAELVLSSMLMEKTKSNVLLTDVFESLKETEGVSFKGPRIHISGSMLPDFELFDLVEACGGMVVSDDLCMGSRYFWDPVDEVKPPLTALTERYLGMSPCAGMCSQTHFHHRAAQIKAFISAYRIDGVVFAIQNFCDPQQFDCPLIAEALEQDGVPFLMIEIEKGINKARVKNQLEAFFEIVGKQ
ncbi:2-hydroxyacyl-CoA dehydratase subunit D [Thermodesulfobacteriota bacterium]